VPGVSIAYPTTSLPSAAYLPFWPLLVGALYRLWELMGGGNRFVLYFLLKQPSILADVGVAAFLYRIAFHWTRDRSAALTALTFWSLFPYAITISAIWGQFDSIAVLVVLGALVLPDSLLRNAAYGWGIFVKWVTAIYLPLELFAERGWRRASFLVALAVPILATVLCSLALGWGTTNLSAASVSQSRGGGGGMNWVGILTAPPLAPWLATQPQLTYWLSYLWIPAIFVAGWVSARWFASREPKQVLRAMVVVTSTFLLFRWGLYEQYMLYLFSLVLLDVILFHPERRALFLGTIVTSSAFLLMNNDLGIRFLAPLSPAVTAYTDALDASTGYGTVRIYALIAIALLVTGTLAQLVYVYLREDASPRPWWGYLGLAGHAGAPTAPP
jgi:hypothetical protein